MPHFIKDKYKIKIQKLQVPAFPSTVVFDRVDPKEIFAVNHFLHPYVTI